MWRAEPRGDWPGAGAAAVALQGVWNQLGMTRTWQFIFTGVFLLLLGLLLRHHGQIITAVVPLDLYEGTAVLVTGIIAEGGNPYTREFQPQATYVYPPLYNILAAPLSQLFGNDFQLHRSLSAGFIALACITLGLLTWRQSGSRLYALAAAVLWYAALLFYATPISSTNAPGVALFVACLAVPWWRRFSNGSLLFALVCGLLSFYTKQYFILCMAILCLYLFLYVSMARALLLGICFATTLLMSLALMHAGSPYYLDNTLFAPAAAIEGLHMWQILFIQLGFFLRTYLGLLLALVVVAILALRAGGGAAGSADGSRWRGRAGTVPCCANPWITSGLRSSGRVWRLCSGWDATRATT